MNGRDTVEFIDFEKNQYDSDDSTKVSSNEWENISDLDSDDEEIAFGPDRDRDFRDFDKHTGCLKTEFNSSQWATRKFSRNFYVSLEQLYNVPTRVIIYNYNNEKLIDFPFKIHDVTLDDNGEYLVVLNGDQLMMFKRLEAESFVIEPEPIYQIIVHLVSYGDYNDYNAIQICTSGIYIMHSMDIYTVVISKYSFQLELIEINTYTGSVRDTQNLFKYFNEDGTSEVFLVNRTKISGFYGRHRTNKRPILQYHHVSDDLTDWGILANGAKKYSSYTYAHKSQRVGRGVSRQLFNGYWDKNGHYVDKIDKISSGCIYIKPISKNARMMQPLPAVFVTGDIVYFDTTVIYVLEKTRQVDNRGIYLMRLFECKI